ncbi:MAG: putative toxin-antitoxin system toxin component, PIN family [Lentisphaerae bacterium GWF2_50_93]|nr:MAG: putative toxin-antitoxin system toxin component, PIN family [Lentisphaerae bacterium GWF2_50_93]
MRAVVDTNVFISSFFGGNPRKIIDLWKQDRLQLCLSQAIVEEYVEVLLRLGLQDKMEIKELLSLFSKGGNTLFTSETETVTLVADDPDDNKFIECAVALEAEYIVSGDKHLLNIGKYLNIKILSPLAFLNELNKL